MTNWKDFKNWLEKEIIFYDGLKAKIKLEKQLLYGELSETVLTNFIDSLEATLDKNSSYHLFPDFDEYQEFGGLFNERVIFGKKTNQKEIKCNDCILLKKLFSEWKREKETEEWEEFRNELALIVYPGTLFTFDGYNSNSVILEKIRELVKKVSELESKSKELNLKLKNSKAEVGEKSTKNLYEEKNNEILQLKRRLELLEESRNEMVSNREEKIEELENQLENKKEQINWLQDQLKKSLGTEQYQEQIEVNYPAKFRN